MEVYVWGIGCGAGEAFQKGLPLAIVTAFIDQDPTKDRFMGKPVLPPEALKERQPDLIIVTCRQAEEVEVICSHLGISGEKLLFLKSSALLSDRNTRCTAGETILGRELLNALLTPQYVTGLPDSLREHVLSYDNDFIRLSTLELLAKEVKEMPGSMAELGVYKGTFAAGMNTLLPEKRLYLFDSFQGFIPSEGEQARQKNQCTDGFLKAHENTSLRAVMEIMPSPDSVIPMAGYFPESLKNLEDTFCLISLDADLFETTLEGLRYFYPRMVQGGYLLLHDWGSRKLTGVSEALKTFRREWGVFIPSMPLPDIGNSIILQKADK